MAVWRTSNDRRFQNYRAVFTILDVPVVSRAWIDEILDGNPAGASAPKPWLKWRNGGRAVPLVSLPTIQTRSVHQQAPSDGRERALIQAIYEYFRQDPHAFEGCAAKILEMMDENVIDCEVTR